MTNRVMSPRRLLANRALLVAILAALLGAAAFGYLALRYVLDQRAYTRAHEAYLRADCTAAIPSYDQIAAAWRPFDLGNYAARSAPERDACHSFQAVVDEMLAGNLAVSALGYHSFITEHTEGPLARASRANFQYLFQDFGPGFLATAPLCMEIDDLLRSDLIPDPGANLPPLYLACAQVHEAEAASGAAVEMYERLILEYPAHRLAAEAEAELTGLIVDQASTSLCQQINDLLGSEEVPDPRGFLPALYLACAQAQEEEGDAGGAIALHQRLLANYPDHPLAAEAEAALARLIIDQGRSAGAAELPEPRQTGSAQAGASTVIIQNSSPERLRIAFSGPEGRVEELEPCDTCEVYTLFEPAFCPEQGPEQTYTLEPGTYDVLVEAISAPETNPWSGVWSLTSGAAYDHCFFIVRTFGP